MVAIHLVTFGSDDYAPQLERISREAIQTQWFTSIRAFLPKHLDPVFLQKHETFLCGRGYGYWIWKPQVIRQVFDTIPDGDIVVYVDAGCTLNPRASNRFKTYVHLAETHPTGIVSFSMHHLEKDYTKREVFERMGYEHSESGQVCATAMILRKCPASETLIREWSTLTQDHSLIDDTKGPQVASFRDHRHDQSIWSILNKKASTCMIPDDDMATGRMDCPIWGTRIRGSMRSPYTGKL